MGDIRKANSFIECGFKLFEQLKEPLRPDPKPRELMNTGDHCVENLYYGRWNREGFDIGYDEDFDLLNFEPDFRLYYAIAGLHGVCAGWGGYVPYFAEYLRDYSLADAITTNNDVAAIGIKTVLNSLLLIHPSELDFAQRIIVDELLSNECSYGWVPIERHPFSFDEYLFSLNVRTALQVRSYYHCPPQAVYDAFLNPKFAHKWFFATETGEMVVCEIDAKVGGNFTMTDRREGEDVAHIGTFLELDPPNRIVFTLQVPKYSEEMSTIEIDLQPTEYGCELTLTQTYSADQAENRDKFIAGWNMILNNFHKWAFPN